MSFVDPFYDRDDDLLVVAAAEGPALHAAVTHSVADGGPDALHRATSALDRRDLKVCVAWIVLDALLGRAPASSGSLYRGRARMVERVEPPRGRLLIREIVTAALEGDGGLEDALEDRPDEDLRLVVRDPILEMWERTRDRRAEGEDDE